MQERVREQQFGRQWQAGVLEEERGPDGEIAARAGAAQAHAVGVGAQLRGVLHGPEPGGQDVLVRDGEVDAVAGQPVVHGHHHAAAAGGDFPGELVRFAHLRPAAGKSPAVHPHQAGQGGPGRIPRRGTPVTVQPKDAGAVDPDGHGSVGPRRLHRADRYGRGRVGQIRAAERRQPLHPGRIGEEIGEGAGFSHVVHEAGQLHIQAHG